MKKILLVLVVLLMVFSACKKPVKLVKDTYENGEVKSVIECLGDTNHLVKVYDLYPSGDTAKVIYYAADGVSKDRETLFYEGGNFKMGGRYQNEGRVGVWKAFFKNGNLQSVRNYNTNGKEEGIYEVYTINNGHYYLYIQGFFKDGEKRGTWKFFNRDGDIIKSINHSKPKN